MFDGKVNHTSADESFAEGMIGDEYDFVGVFNDSRPDDQISDYEVFIVAVNADI